MDCSTCDRCTKLVRHSWRIHCQQCYCPSYTHKSVYNAVLSQINSTKISDLWINKIKSNEKHNQTNDFEASMNLAINNELMWLPIGIDEENIDDFVDHWKSIIEGEKKLINTKPDQKYPLLTYNLEDNHENSQVRVKIFIYQMPPSDWLKPDSRLSDEELHEYTASYFKERSEIHFKESRDEQNFGFGELEELENDVDECNQCHETIKQVEKYSVQIIHNALKSWHVGCFKCATCHSLLLDYHYFWDESTKNIYCMRHYGDLKQNRCGSCDQLIFDQDFTKAMSQEYHVEHFACKNCDKSLTGERYILKEEDPYCLECFNEKYSHNCDRCQKMISCDNKDLSFNNRHWHHECFFCDNCKVSLYEKQFGSRDDKMYCPECFESKFQVRCDKCQKAFKHGSKKFEYNNQQWHEECFLCCECEKPIGSKGFVPKKNEEQKVVLKDGITQLICIECYEDKYAQKCCKCKKVIRRGGVAYHGESWHKECFLCTKCECQLADIKFTTKDEKPYCPDCFAELYSRRCKNCQKPISGFGGCKYVSLDDDNWHTDCFICNGCSNSLVGKGFMNHEDKILCVACYNQTARTNGETS